MANDITLGVLQQYRDFMTVSQLERYGYYLMHTIPPKPFTWAEIKGLEQRKDFSLLRMKMRFRISDCRNTIERLRTTMDETISLMSQLDEFSDEENLVRNVLMKMTA